MASSRGRPASPPSGPSALASPDGRDLAAVLRDDAPDEALTWRRAFASPHVEATYQDAVVRELITPLRWLCTVATASWILGYLLDRQVAGSEANYRTLLWVRFTTAPVAVAAAAALWGPPAFVRRIKEVALLGLTGVVVLAPLVMVMIVPEPARVGLGAAPASTALVAGASCTLAVAGVRLDALCGMLLATAIVWTVTVASSPWEGKGPLVYSGLMAGVIGTVGALIIDKARREAFVAHRAAERERARSDALIRNVLPDPIAARLRERATRIADHFDEATVLFADLAGFTPLTAELTAPALVDTLDEIFSDFDDIARAHGLEKIKTIGDAYMVAGGVPTPRADHTVAVIEMALAMRDAIAGKRFAGGRQLQIRIGVDTGPVVAGVIGKQKFIYDLWGDTANTASRMESHGVPGKIHVTAAVAERLGDAFLIEPRGAIQVKGKGEMRTAFVERKPAPG